MAISFTKEQQRVIDTREKNMLVSAAAGSGKTAVLVERILSMITEKNHPIDVDKLLVVTFTNAAAAEMRERIHQAILGKLEEEQDNEHLQKQATYVQRAQITTIDSFCKYLIDNHFETIGLDPALRVADKGECDLLMQDTMAEMMEALHSEKRESFLSCLESFVAGKKESVFEEYILKLYSFAMSYPFPKEWLEHCRQQFACSSLEEYQQSESISFAVLDTSEVVLETIHLLEEAEAICEEADGPYMYGAVLEHEIAMLETLERADTFQELYVQVNQVSFGRLPSKKDASVSVEKRELAKELRNQAKELIKGLKEDYFFVSLEQNYADLCACRMNAEELLFLAEEFMNRFAVKKQEKKIMDFSDMEHFALSILLEEMDGEKVPTQTALAYRDYFEEIMIDEYQDSNMVQELILSSIAKQDNQMGNRFMVGDVKQSIYKFRLARPEIFMEKFHTFRIEEGDEGATRDVRIDLDRNFRSRRQVIDSVNLIFKEIMKSSIGGVEYDKEAFLNPGADYEGKDGNYQTELLLFERKSLDGEETIKSALSTKEGEAVLVGNKIRSLMGTLQVTDKQRKELRPVCYGDIVILLRSVTGYADVFKEELEKQGIPVYVNSQTGYFSAMEVRQVLDYLRVLNNPYQDIALCGVLKSPFFDFTDEELAWIKGICGTEGRKQYFYTCMQACSEEVELSAKQRQKITQALETIDRYREKSVYRPIHELIWEMLQDSSYLDYISAMKAGVQRKANVEMLIQKAVEFEKTSYHGLFQFVRYIEKLEKYNMDFGEAGTLDENMEAVRIMTIHKSKGLEFPVCFVSGLSKRYNMQDLASPVLTDMELGIGIPYIDPVKRIKGKTIFRNVISKKGRKDNLGEELRILYVALTRAKEKLIMTGGVESMDSLMKGTIPSYGMRIGASNHLMLIVAALIQNEAFSNMCQVFHEEDLQREGFVHDVSGSVRKERLLHNEIIDKELERELEEKFSFQYKYAILGELYTKTSVSELKRAAMHIDEETNITFETEETADPYLPKYMREATETLGSERGNAYHRVLELLSYKKYKDLSMESYGSVLKQDIQTFVKEGKITQEYVNMIDESKIINFLESKSAQRMMDADAHGKLYKEGPFVMAIPANELNEAFPKEETILIQGIIDVYFEEAGELVVLDYKTDRVNRAEELIKRYETQLDYYEKALSRLKAQPVREKIIYSFSLETEIIWQ